LKRDLSHSREAIRHRADRENKAELNGDAIDAIQDLSKDPLIVR
jgi:hypothetical protein